MIEGFAIFTILTIPPSVASAAERLTALPGAPRDVLLGVLGFVLCCLAAGICYLLERHLGRRTGLPSSIQVVSSDMGTEVGRETVKMLFEPRYRMRGRPDYVLRVRSWRGRWMVPVEVKPTRHARQPYENDIMELMTYLILVRATYPTHFAGYGLLRYADVTFQVPLTPELERRCAGYAELVRRARSQTVVHRNHETAARCGGCRFHTQCDEALRR